MLTKTYITGSNPPPQKKTLTAQKVKHPRSRRTSWVDLIAYISAECNKISSKWKRLHATTTFTLASLIWWTLVHSRENNERDYDQATANYCCEIPPAFRRQNFTNARLPPSTGADISTFFRNWNSKTGKNVILFWLIASGSMWGFRLKVSKWCVLVTHKNISFPESLSSASDWKPISFRSHFSDISCTLYSLFLSVSLPGLANKDVH